MSINVEKMDAKHNDSVHKSKPLMKRRKKNSSISDLSSDSLSPPKRQIRNGFPDEYRSSPETVFHSTFHSILPNMNTSNGTLNGHHNNINDNDDSKSSEIVNDYSSLVSRNGSMLSDSNQSPMHCTTVNHHSDDSDSTSSVNKSQRQPRTPEDFYLFCQFILEYANYDEMCDKEDLRSTNNSPLDSTGSAAESTISSPVNDESNHTISNTVDTPNELNDKNPDELNDSTLMSESNSNDVSKASAMDVSSTNEDDDSADIDAESYNLITCYCGKPYAARPMIECSRCLTWLHLSCAKIKRKKIPDIFICVKCAKKSNQQTMVNMPISPSSSSPPSPSSVDTIHSPKDLKCNEPKENNRSKKSIGLTNSQMRSDKLENSILQPINVSAAYETGGNNLENIKTAPTVSSIAVKYK